MSKNKSIGNQSLFDARDAARKLSEKGNPLEKLGGDIDFSAVDAALRPHPTT